MLIISIEHISFPIFSVDKYRPPEPIATKYARIVALPFDQSLSCRFQM